MKVMPKSIHLLEKNTTGVEMTDGKMFYQRFAADAKTYNRFWTATLQLLLAYKKTWIHQLKPSWEAVDFKTGTSEMF